MPGVELNLPASRHLRSDDGAIPGRSFIPGDISIHASDLAERGKLPKGILPFAMAGSLLLAACAGSKPPEPSPTPTLSPVPTITPIPIGGGDSLVCDPKGVIVREDGKTPATPFPTEEQIKYFNSCVIAQKQSAEATATAEAQKPTPTPEKRLTQEEAVVSVNQIISLIQNPDQALVTKLDLDPVRLDEDQKRLVYGFFGKAGSETNYAPESLYGLRALIQEGQIEEAKKLLKKPLINYLTGPVSSRDIEARNDSGEWNEQQLEKYDPRELVFPWRTRQYKVQGISRIKEQALITALKLYYGL